VGNTPKRQPRRHGTRTIALDDPRVTLLDLLGVFHLNAHLVGVGDEVMRYSSTT
jgi:hypothetical protein